MLKLLFVLFALPVMLVSQTVCLPEFTCEVDMVKGYNNGAEIIINQEVEGEEIKKLFNEVVASSREMPAFGVSLHEETLKAMKEGVWLLFDFGETKDHNEMPFESLLINIEKDTGGVNIIRYYNGQYSGRCFYLDLDKNFNDLYDYMVGLETKELENKAEEEKVCENCASAEIPSVPNGKDNDKKVI